MSEMCGIVVWSYCLHKYVIHHTDTSVYQLVHTELLKAATVIYRWMWMHSHHQEHTVRQVKTNWWLREAEGHKVAIIETQIERETELEERQMEIEAEFEGRKVTGERRQTLATSLFKMCWMAGSEEFNMYSLCTSVSEWEKCIVNLTKKSSLY